VSCVDKLEPYTEPWQDLVFGPVSCDVASVEGDPVSSSHVLTDVYVSQIYLPLFGVVVFSSLCSIELLCSVRLSEMVPLGALGAEERPNPFPGQLA